MPVSKHTSGKHMVSKDTDLGSRLVHSSDFSATGRKVWFQVRLPRAESLVRGTENLLPQKLACFAGDELPRYNWGVKGSLAVKAGGSLALRSGNHKVPTDNSSSLQWLFIAITFGAASNSNAEVNSMIWQVALTTSLALCGSGWHRNLTLHPKQLG